MKAAGTSRLSLSRTAALSACLFWAALSAAGNENYLIVSAPDYVDTAPLNQFINHRAERGYDVSVYSVPVGTSREDIKAYIQSLWGTPAAPHFLLIVGDTNGTPATHNTIPHWVGEGSRHAATDLPYACMDGPGDWYPNLFQGRFSVTSASLLQQVVDKTLTVESGTFSDPGYARRACMIATDDPTAGADALHDSIINNYFQPAGFTSTRVYGDQGGDTADIAAAVNDGVLFTVYFGHSTESGWYFPAFYQGDVNALTNDGLYGLAMGWSCNSAHFDSAECFGETWLRAAHKGAAAYLSSSGLVWWGSVEAWESSRRMERYFFQSVFQEKIWRIGPAWQAALWKILADPDFGPTHDQTRNIFEEFVLLGDPALCLPFGALSLSLPDGAPEFVAPGAPTPITLRIASAAEVYVPGSGLMYYRCGGGDYQPAELTPTGDTLFQALLPAAACGTTLQFYFSASGDQGTTVKLPEKAPDRVFSAGVATVTTLLAEDFEADNGWTVWNDPSLTSGAWERCIPASPAATGAAGADFDGSGRCFVTDNRSGDYDVDGGPTVLTSPLIDLSGWPDTYIDYAAWMYCDDLGAPQRDFLELELSPDGGESWVAAPHVSGTGNWFTHEVRVNDYLTPTAQFRMRFSIADQPDDSRTEAAVDAVRIQNRVCQSAAAGDLNCDGAINAFDIDPFVLALTDPAAYAAAYPACDYMLADINGDGTVNAFDIDPFVGLLAGN